MSKLIIILMAVALGTLATANADDRIDDHGASALSLDELRAFTEAFGHVQREYIDETTDQQLLENAIRGMLAGLDEHTEYLSRQEYSALTDNTRALYGGIGVELLWQEQAPVGLRVIGVRDDSPAWHGGILKTMLIVSVDGRSLQGMVPANALALLRGPIDSTVRVGLREDYQDPDSNLLEFELNRQLIHVESVASELLINDVGYLVLTSFNIDTAATALRQLEQLRLRAGGELAGLVIDLRGNGGGIVQAAVNVADLFLNQGLIVYAEGRVESASVRHQATDGDQIGGAPIAVLVDRQSASASEIVAGALQDHQRALIIGERTYGKGSIQTVLALRNGGGIKLTTSRYYTPNGRSINGSGIVPDLAAKPPGENSNGEADPPLAAALDWLSQQTEKAGS